MESPPVDPLLQSYMLIDDYQPTQSKYNLDLLSSSIFLGKPHQDEEESPPVARRERPRVEANKTIVKLYSEQVCKLVSELTTDFKAILSHDHFEHFPEDPPLRIVSEIILNDPETVQKIVELFNKQIASATEELAEGPFKNYKTAIQQANVEQRVAIKLEQIGQAFIQGESAKACKAELANCIEPLQEMQKFILLSTGMALFDTHKQMIGWLDTTAGTLRLTKNIFLNILDGYSWFSKHFEDAPVIKPIKRIRYPEESLGKQVERVSRQVEPLILALLAPVHEELSEIYAAKIKGYAQSTLEHFTARALSISTPALLRKLAKRATRIFQLMFEVRGPIKPKVPNQTKLLKKLDEVDGRHTFVPLSLKRKETRKAEEDYFKERMFPLLEKMLTENGLIYDLTCILTRGSVPQKEEDPLTDHIAKLTANQLRERLINELAKQFSNWFNTFATARSINKAIISLVADMLEEEVKIEYNLKIKATYGISEEDTLYRKAAISMEYLALSLNEGEGMTKDFLGAMLLRVHHLLQTKSFAKNLFFHCFDVILDSLRETKTDKEKLLFPIERLKLHETEDDEATRIALGKLLGHLLSYGMEHMDTESHWYSTLLYKLGSATVDRGIAHGFLGSQITSNFGDNWPLRTDKVLEAILISLEKNLAENKNTYVNLLLKALSPPKKAPTGIGTDPFAKH